MHNLEGIMPRSHRNAFAEPLEPRRLLAVIATPTHFDDPSYWQLNGAEAAVVGNNTVLRLTPDSPNWYASAFNKTPQKIDRFDDVSFEFMITGENGSDGFTFCLQADDSDDIAFYTDGLAYEGIPNSMAIKFDVYDPDLGPISQTGLYFNGEHPKNSRFGGDIDLRPALGSLIGTYWRVHLSYSASTLRMDLFDIASPGRSFSHSWTVNLAAEICSDTAYPGFTGSTGEIPVQQDIYDFHWRRDIGDPWTIDGTDSSDAITLKRDGDNLDILAESGMLIERRRLDSVLYILCNTKAGDDLITLDLSAGPIVPPGGAMTFNAADGYDTLKVKGVDVTNKDVIIGNSQLNLGDTTINVSGLEAVYLDPGPSGILGVKSLTIGYQTSLDLAKGTLIINKTGGTTASQIFYYLASARNEGSWDGKGLVSSAAAARFLTDDFTGLTMAEDGNGNIVVKYSWNGDVNQDGIINADDYFAVDSGFITQVGGYENGDLNYDDMVNADDYFLIDSAYIGQSSALASESSLVLRPSSFPLPLVPLRTPSQLLGLFTRKRTEMPDRDPF